MNYRDFLKDQLQQALKQAEKYRYDQPLEEPKEIYELEAYLQDVLGFIQLNEVISERYKTLAYEG